MSSTSQRFCKRLVRILAQRFSSQSFAWSLLRYAAIVSSRSLSFVLVLLKKEEVKVVLQYTAAAAT